MKTFTRFVTGDIMYYVNKVLKILLRVLIVIVAALAVFAGCHHLLLVFEEPLLVPEGALYDTADGAELHVYSQGANENYPSLVFLSGSGTPAPVYDFKPLYAQLSDEFETVVVEKPGYGYSPVSGNSREIGVVVDEMRSALEAAHIPQPYILAAHSMGGLEAQYWAKTYPDEVAGIVGLDMAIPSWYSSSDFSFPAIQKYALWLFAQGVGLQRLDFVYHINRDGLTDYEYDQSRFLTYKQAMNSDVLAETDMVVSNAEKVAALGYVKDKPMLMFTSDGRETGENWILYQQSYARECGAELIALDCGHYVHVEKTAEIAAEMKSWIKANF